jgi:hypothetical protein
MVETRVTLVPQSYDSHAIEQILVLDHDLYPVALLHIDFFWDKNNHEIHDKLSDGMAVECELRLKEVI